MFNTNWLMKIACVAVLSEVVYQMSKRIYMKLNCVKNNLTYYLVQAYQHENVTNKFHKVLFFPDSGIPCKTELAGRVCKNKNCFFEHGKIDETSLGVLLRIIKLTRKKLDVCVFVITCSILADALIECHDRGIIVRVITDERNSGEEGEVTGIQVERLRDAGIIVYCHISAFWMHHKFIIADDEILVNGSFNWTNQAIMGNYENLIITSEEKIVQPFINEFDKLWHFRDSKKDQEISNVSINDSIINDVL